MRVQIDWADQWKLLPFLFHIFNVNFVHINLEVFSRPPAQQRPKINQGQARECIMFPPSHILPWLITHTKFHEKYNEKYEWMKDKMIHIYAKFQVEQKFVQRQIKMTNSVCYRVKCTIHQDPQTCI
jgi:hypothetical protein